MPNFIQIHPNDNVVVALRAVPKGTVYEAGNLRAAAAEDIPQGHKMAVAPVEAGENVV